MDSLFHLKARRGAETSQNASAAISDSPRGTVGLPMGGDPIIGQSGFVTLRKNRNIPAGHHAIRFVRSFGQLLDLYRIGAILLGSPIKSVVSFLRSRSMSHRVATVPLLFQWVTKRGGNSMRHECDIQRPGLIAVIFCRNENDRSLASWDDKARTGRRTMGL